MHFEGGMGRQVDRCQNNLTIRVCILNWSTDFKTPVMQRSFLSSTVTLWSVKVLNTEKMSYDGMNLDEWPADFATKCIARS